MDHNCTFAKWLAKGKSGANSIRQLLDDKATNKENHTGEKSKKKKKKNNMPKHPNTPFHRIVSLFGMLVLVFVLLVMNSSTSMAVAEVDEVVEIAKLAELDETPQQQYSTGQTKRYIVTLDYAKHPNDMVQDMKAIHASRRRLNLKGIQGMEPTQSELQIKLNGHLEMGTHHDLSQMPGSNEGQQQHAADDNVHNFRRHLAFIEVDDTAHRLITEVEGVRSVEEDGDVWLADENFRSEQLEKDPASDPDWLTVSKEDENATRTTAQTTATTATATAATTTAASSSPISAQTSSGSIWGLDRIDQKLGLDGTYWYPNTAKDIDIYVVDTGVYAEHEDFSQDNYAEDSDGTDGKSRVLKGANMVPFDNSGANVDCNSHGTHVASTAAGKKYGIAKQAIIIPVKTVGCNGRGSTSSLASGIEWVIAEAKKRPNRKAIVNISLSSSVSLALNSAVADATAAGIVVVAAAGNGNGNACSYSPASSSAVITVGASRSDDSKWRRTNTGSCVDVFAPGSDVLAAHIGGPSASISKSGTSMGTPHVTGIVAMMQQDYLNWSPKKIAQEVVNDAVPLEYVLDEGCSGIIKPNRFAQIHRRIPRSWPWQMMVSGKDAKSEYYVWPPQFSVNKMAAGEGLDELCVTFSAKLASTNNGASDRHGRIYVAFASSPSPNGFSAYRSARCREKEYSYYTVEAGGSRTSRVYKGTELVEEGSGETGLLEHCDSKKFYARAWKEKDGEVHVQLGEGSQPGKRVLVHGKDSSVSSAAKDLKSITFSSSRHYDIEYLHIKPCSAETNEANQTNEGASIGDGHQNEHDDADDADDADEEDDDDDDTNSSSNSKDRNNSKEYEHVPTARPSSSPTVTPTLAPTMTSAPKVSFKAPKHKSKGWFRQFWKLESNCLQFDIKGPQNGIVTLSANDEPFRFNQDNDAYSFRIGRRKNHRRQQHALYRRGKIVARKNTNHILRRRSWSTMRVEYDKDKLSLYYSQGPSATEILGYVKRIPNDIEPKYFSLAGLTTGTIHYKNVGACTS